MLTATSQMQTLPGNPLIVVAPFLSEGGEGHLPWAGRVISEILLMGLWQIPSLNIYHHWLLPHTRWHITFRHKHIDGYVAKLVRTTRAKLVVTGTYRLIGKRAEIRCGMWDTRASKSVRLAGEVQVEGRWDHLLEWLPGTERNLLQESFPDATIDFPALPTLVDAPVEALELACAAIDCLTFEEGEEPARLYMRQAQTLAPNSVYLLFTSTRIGEQDRDVSFCSELVQQKPDFVPAYFADTAVGTEDTDKLHRAKELYIRGLSLCPFNMHGYFGLRQICAKLGDAQTLIPFAKIHVTRGTFSTPRSQFGDTFQTCMEIAAEYGQYEMARQLFHSAMEMAGDQYDQAMLLNTRGYVEEVSGNAKEAIKFYAEARRKYRAPHIKAHLARVYFSTQDYVQAASLYESLVRCPKGLDRESQIWARYRFARCLEHLGREQEAMEIYNRLYPLQPFSDFTYTIIFDAYRRWQLLRQQHGQKRQDE